MSESALAYGLWSLVIVNSAIFIFFAYTFFKPQTPRNWRSFSAFSAFLVALLAEMYGFPLTIYFLSGWLQSRFPDVDWFSHDAGHLFGNDVRLENQSTRGAVPRPEFCVYWRRLHPDLGRLEGTLSCPEKTGSRDREPYSYVRHPQYVGFVLVMFDFLLQWPTILTLAIRSLAEFSIMNPLGAMAVSQRIRSRHVARHHGRHIDGSRDDDC